MVSALLIYNGLIQMRRRRAFTKKYGDVGYTPEHAMRELAAAETGEDFVSGGGVIEHDTWGDETVSTSMQEENTNHHDQSDYSLDGTNSIENMAGLPQSSMADVTLEAAESVTPPSSSPPLPPSGLPAGWTMEQWKWYGHEWLKKNS